MTVLLTGATGYVGGYVLDALLRHGHAVRALVREGVMPNADPMVEAVRGDILEPETLVEPMRGVDAVVHLVGIIEEDRSKGVTFERVHVDGTRHVVGAALASGVERFVHMSANGARPDGVSAYQTTKWQAEEIVRAADFDHWVIFRPSTMFGDPGPDNPEFAKQLWQTLIQPFPVLPVFGDGSYEMQPVHVESVAEAFAQAVTRDESNGRAYCAAGPQRLAYTEVLKRIAHGGGLKAKPTVPVPMPVARLAVNTLGRVGVLPISPAQFEMLVEGNTCDPTVFVADFDVPTPVFDGAGLSYLRKY